LPHIMTVPSLSWS